MSPSVIDAFKEERWATRQVVDTSKLSDDEAVTLFNQIATDWKNGSLACGGCNPAFAFAPFMTQWGWNNSPDYIKARKELEQGGNNVTHEKLNGKVPTREEATRMIEENGGTIVRQDIAHPEGGVSTHTEPHINYKTSTGERHTVIVKE